MRKAKFVKPKKVPCPTFELVSCPSVKIKDVKRALRNKDPLKALFNIRITDTVLNTSTTLRDVVSTTNRIFDKYAIPEDKKLQFWKNVGSMSRKAGKR